MYCKNCNSYNDDNSRFCCQCGAQLEPAVSSEQSGQEYAAPQNNSGYADQYSSARADYSNPQYAQPNYGTQTEPTAPLNNTMAIVSIVINIVIFNVLGLIFAILSLTNYNSYESALRAGNFTLSEQLKARSKKYSKVAIIIAIVMAVLAVIAGIVAFVAFFLSAGGISGGFDDPFEYEYGYENFMMMLAPYFG